MTEHTGAGAAADPSGGWLDDAASHLQQGAVYVSPDVANASGLQTQLAKLVPSDGSIAVVVLPDQAYLDSKPYPTYLLDKLFDGTHYGSLVVAIGTDLQATSRTIPKDEAMSIANEAEISANGNTANALTAAVQRIEASVPEGESTSGGAGPAVAWLLPVGIVAALVAAGIVTAITVLRRRRGRRAEPAAIPSSVNDRLTRLSALQQDYARLGAGDAIAARTATTIGSLVGTVSQLFPRLDARAADDQRGLAEVEYTDKLGRLVAALDRDYLLDILQNPQLWEDPDERIQEVQEALDAVSQQALDNVKQVNARKALHFQVSLDSLVGRDELRDWEREFTRNSKPTDSGEDQTDRK
ncbi:hypothetical protein [Microbacterium sp. 2MCAF23]|uniref:hypothetical protein n=1 Tax=Microbacterium sp. 2MCAF23 TaxID=3232985 RepID=UPI003F99D428